MYIYTGVVVRVWGVWVCVNKQGKMRVREVGVY